MHFQVFLNDNLVFDKIQNIYLFIFLSFYFNANSLRDECVHFKLLFTKENLNIKILKKKIILYSRIIKWLLLKKN